MPKATLSFNLPEEESEHNIAVRGGDFYCALWDILNIIRAVDKYDKKLEEAIDEIRETVHGVNFDGIS